MSLENLTAADYLTAKGNARQSSAAKAAYTKMIEGLKEHPHSRERLLFQILAMTAQSLEADSSPRASILDALRFEEAVSGERAVEFLVKLEEIALLSFKKLERTDYGTGDYLALKLTLSVALTGIRKRNEDRFQAALSGLLRQVGEKTGDARLKILQNVAGKGFTGIP